MKTYLFTSERLGFRNWLEQDKLKMHIINSDPQVMEYFPAMPNKNETNAFVDRMKALFSNKGFCYFAVDRLDNNAFIGFIGIAEKTFEADFTPCIDIGWRLDKREWGRGYASEGAKKCLEFAFDKMALKNIKSICPVANKKSEKVMKKIGMKKVRTFNHPLLANSKELEACVLYEIERAIKAS